MLNWAIPEVRAHKFALIKELCTNYDFDGLEMDFMRFYALFALDQTTSAQRRRDHDRFCATSARGVGPHHARRPAALALCPSALLPGRL